MRQYKKDELYPNTNMLSSSQILDYMKDPSEFYSTWILGIERPMGAACMAGIAFSELYADRKFKFREFLEGSKVSKRLVNMLENIVNYFPQPEKPEYELIVEFNGWKFRVTLDDFYKKFETIVENKTSVYEFTKEAVKTYAQFTLQQWAYWKKYKKLPKKHIINWVDTSANATKLINTFNVKRTVTQLKAFEGLIVEALENLEAKNFTKKFTNYESRKF